MKNNKKQTIGIIGGGQLGRMICIAAKQMGYVVGVLDPIANCPAAQVSDWHILSTYDDVDALVELKEKCNIITYELEHLSVEKLKIVQERLPQGLLMLEQTQDRLLEKRFLMNHNIPVVPYHRVEQFEDSVKAGEILEFPFVLKKRFGGYDGKSQWKIHSEEELKKLSPDVFQNCIAEKWIKFSKELSIMIGRNSQGEVCLFPIAENRHREHILAETIVPARIEDSTAATIEKYAVKISQSLKSQGVLGIEFFYESSGAVYVNELAPRPHNSGHYSIEACDYSQFDIHVRSICQWSIPEKVRLFCPVKMENILGQDYENAKKKAKQDSKYHFHDYGKKEKKHNRKVGHLTYFIGNEKE